jgi:hypothetical protein
MGMTIDDCAKMLIAKEKCMERETSGTDTECNLHNCDDCSLCYEQGTMGEQKETLKFAVDTMRKYQKIEQIIADWKSDGGVFEMSEPYWLRLISEVIGDGDDNN